MRGMRTPGIEFETANLRTLAAAETPSGLARLQEPTRASTRPVVRAAKVTAAQNAWDVVLRGKVIDTTYYDVDCDADYVKKSLIDHDGYDPSITVRKRAMAAKVVAAEAEEVDEELEPETEVDEFVDEEPTAPEDGDFVIYDSGALGSRTSVAVQGGGHLGEFSSIEAAEKAIAKQMKTDNFTPNVWYQDDHGGIQLYELPEGLTAGKKRAAIYDAYAHRVTIETHSGVTNGSYTAVINMLSGADLSYREVRRYTIDPDRVCMDVLIKDEDVELIQELAKAVEEDGISISFNSNISEAIKPKQVVTIDKDMSSDSPKTAGKRVKANDAEWVEEDDGTMVNDRTGYRIVPLPRSFKDKFDIEDAAAEVVGHANTMAEAQEIADELAGSNS